MRKGKIKSVKLIALGLVLMLSLAGCGNQIPELTESQTKEIGEYAAVTLLKYDAKHRSRLVDDATIEAYDLKQQSLLEYQSGKKPQAEPEGMKPVENTPVVENNAGGGNAQKTAGSLEDSLAVPEGITVTYKEYKLCDNYPEDGSTSAFFTLDASAGKKLLVLSFDVNNGTGADAEVDFFSSSSVFSVDTGSGVKHSAMTTMLMDDMSTYAGTIKAGESRSLVLLFEIEQSEADAIGNLTLYFRGAGESYTVQL